MMATNDKMFDTLVSLNITTLGNYNLILGMPWLKAHSGWVCAAGPSLLLMDPQLSPPYSTIGATSLVLPIPSVVSPASSLVLKASPTLSLHPHLSHFSDIFAPYSSRFLPPHPLGFDCKIVLKPDSLPPYSHPYLVFKDEELEFPA